MGCITAITGDGQVFDVACTLGGLLTCDVAAMDAGDTGALRSALEDDDLVLGVMDAGFVDDALTAVSKPLVLVPPAPVRPSAGRATVVVPLDGFGALGAEGAALLGDMAGAGFDLVGVRMVDPTAVPLLGQLPPRLPGLVLRFPHRLPVPRRPRGAGTGNDGHRDGPLARTSGAALMAVSWSAPVPELVRTTRTPVLLRPSPTACRLPAAVALSAAV